MGVLPSEYINITKLFLPMRKSTCSIFDQYLSYHFIVIFKDHDKDTHELEKLFSILVLLDNLADDVLDIINNLWKKTKEQN